MINKRLTATELDATSLCSKGNIKNSGLQLEAYGNKGKKLLFLHGVAGLT